MVPSGLSQVDLQIFSQLPVVALFAVIVLKMLNGFKQYLKDRDESNAKTTEALTRVIAEMSKQVNFLAVSLAENRSTGHRQGLNSAGTSGD